MSLDASLDPDPNPRTTRPPRSGRLLVGVLWFAVCALIAGATWYAYATLDVRNDEYQLILLGRTVAEGGSRTSRSDASPSLRSTPRSTPASRLSWLATIA